jgi:hypothetical protein
MPSFVVQQPNGLLGYFSTVSDQFDVMNATEEEMEELLLEYMGRLDIREKIARGRGDELSHVSDAPRPDKLGRWISSMAEIFRVHGPDEFQRCLEATIGESDYPREDLAVALSKAYTLWDKSESFDPSSLLK